MPHMMDPQMHEEMQRCIDECLRCHSVCLETDTYCLQKGGQHAEAHHIITLLDCAEICQASANFMLRGSEMHAHVCGVCAEACGRCAQSCEQYSDDAQMESCAQECRRCEGSCRRMASMTPTTPMTPGT